MRVRRPGRPISIEREDDHRICKKKSCTTLDLADAKLAQIDQWKGSGHQKPVRAYQCQHCQLWHLTHWRVAPAALDDSDARA